MNTGGFRRRPGDGSNGGSSEGSNGAAFLDAGAAAYRQAVERLNQWAESATVYLRDRRPADIGADVTRLARERPEQTLVAAALLGVLAGTLLHSLARR